MNESKIIDEWLTVLKINFDKESPFKGLIDISPILELPINLQKKIFNLLPQDIQKEFNDGNENPST
tara:strand:+ start:225 stop:422 length:198 start_codon:yes stop_codon:yes gene_type:complete